MNRKQEFIYYGMSIVAAVSSGAIAFSWKGSLMRGLVVGMSVLAIYVIVVSAWDIQHETLKERYQGYEIGGSNE